jgi:NAD(P) transhydrogenase subunit alpha
MVEQMRSGAVIIDVAAPTGGNCELTRPGEDVEIGGVTVIGRTDLPGLVARDASEMYARNVTAFVELITDEDGGFRCDLDNEIVAGACITHDGRVIHPVTRRSLDIEETDP